MGLIGGQSSHSRAFEKLMTQFQTQDHIRRIYSEPRSQEKGRLLKFGFKAYSQNEEDGIIQEIFKRIGTTNRTFVEFGVEGGLENNSLYLLLQGWNGLWIEGNPKQQSSLRGTFKSKIESKQLNVLEAFVTPQNFTSLLTEQKIPKEFDLLSVDIDGNDYHVFKSLEGYSPRVVVMEYNAKMHPPLQWVMKFNPQHQWDGTDYFGASLKSFEQLLDSKGYALVGCNITGSNAFFVRKDLVQDKFCAPFTAENHYEPARYHLSAGLVSGHAPNFGEFESL